MVEVLVAVTVTAAGLGAALGLALASFAATAEARRAELAAMLAADLAGRVRALDAVDWTSLPEPQPCQPDCRPDELAALEFAEWLGRVTSALPDSEARLTRDDPEVVLLSLRWRETGGAARELRVEVAP